MSFITRRIWINTLSNSYFCSMSLCRNRAGTLSASFNYLFIINSYIYIVFSWYRCSILPLFIPPKDSFNQRYREILCYPLYLMNLFHLAYLLLIKHSLYHLETMMSKPPFMTNQNNRGNAMNPTKTHHITLQALREWCGEFSWDSWRCLYYSGWS